MSAAGADPTRRSTFDTAAELYDAARPGHPDDLIDAVVRHSGLREVDRVLEVGSVTGIATPPLLERGLVVTCVELGTHLADVAQPAWKSCSVLAYVFWHTPDSVDGISTYEASLATFHRSLDPADISGFRGSQAFLVHGAPWVSSPVVYEDWYFVDDFTALGALNEAAVSGPRRRPHDNVAGMAGEGMAGVYALCRGAAQLSDAQRAVWFDKTAGMSYGDFLDRCGEGISLWQRQMVLGPTPEFCSVDDDEDLPTGAVVVTRLREVGASAS